jgi:hypothetical protein
MCTVSFKFLSLCALWQVPSAPPSSSGLEIKALRFDMQIMHKQHTEELTIMKQQLAQLVDDNKQLFAHLLPKREAAAAKCSNFATERSDTLHEQMHQLATSGTFVGIGDYYYVASVCRNWRGRYMKLCGSTAAGADSTGVARELYTLHTNTVISESRLQLALDNGLAVQQLNLTHPVLVMTIFCRSFEPKKVLTLARLYGSAWSECTPACAAAATKYDMLMWLLKCGCPLDLVGMLEEANNSRYGLDHLKTLRAITGPWPAKELAIMLWCAGRHDELDTVKWLCEQAAAWPKSYCKTATGQWSECWSLRCVQWALANGSAFLEWRCQDLVAHQYYCKLGVDDHTDDTDTCKAHNCSRKNAIELCQWAHENGCPCTCGDVALAALEN